MNLPKISIITPSFNQGQYIEQTILSVIEQGYENLEYIIIDGGSSDNTLKIIKKYEKYITCWVSEKDKGQSDAINKGIKLATGDIINWLNSDDYYMPGALDHVATVFSNPDTTVYCGRSRVFSDSNVYYSQGSDVYVGNLAKTIGWARIDQPETFFRKKVWDCLEMVNEHFHYIMDKELWIRYLMNFGLKGIVKDQEIVVNFRIHEQSKTGSQLEKFTKETIDLYYTLAKAVNLDIAYKISEIQKVQTKEIFGYSVIDVGFMERVLHYFLLKVCLEAYAQNKYQLVRKVASYINTELLERDDVKELRKVLFRMSVIPVYLKRLINGIH
jgi:glycosyltransferase involved in cell wall biosynthesis